MRMDQNLRYLPGRAAKWDAEEFPSFSETTCGLISFVELLSTNRSESHADHSLAAADACDARSLMRNQEALLFAFFTVRGSAQGFQLFLVDFDLSRLLHLF